MFVQDDQFLWNIYRPVTSASDPAGRFVGQSDLVALNIDLKAGQQGALVVSGKRFGATQCLGLATPLPKGQGVLILSNRVIDVFEALSAEVVVIW